MELLTLLPLLLLALGNMHYKSSRGCITVDIGTIKNRDELKFAYQFPATMPIIDIKLKH
ncbi:hypothetical protein OTK49_03480 [Vibrio coralliirubri]|uniref:hypothetical protein n=1 Tax=Vibrio coralliirubri TaxID=1516159 RepID=UPI0022838104|nr:hypothetical protein [Vibrio coralliirubri]MCY9861579.1 hypothetical protein [Vibrio coralliirubri]